MIDTATNTYEHANWITADAIEQGLGRDLQAEVIRSSELRSKNSAEQVRLILSMPTRFVPVVGDDQRFEYLVRRDVLVEQVAKAATLDA